MSSEPATRSLGDKLVLLVHWAIILNFVIQIVYAAYMIFDVLAVGDGGPIGRAALSVDHEHMVTRRLYAIEFWVAMGGLAIYLAITEIGPECAPYFEPGGATNMRTSPGGAGPSPVAVQIAAFAEKLSESVARLNELG